MRDRFTDGSHRGRWRLILRPTTLLLAVLVALGVASPAAAAGDYERPVVIRLEGPITPLTPPYIDRRLEDARALGSNLVIIEIDSPGGEVESSFAVAERLAEISWATTVAYIPKQALSGASFVALGCEQILIHPRARLGDAGVIQQGADFQFRHVPEKIVSNYAVRIRQLADVHHRPPALAESMIRKDLPVFEVTHKETGTKTYMSDAEIQSSADPDAWQKGQMVLESREGHFLTVTGERALELGLADANATNLEEVQKYFGLDGLPIRLAGSWVDTLVFVLNSTLVTVLLLVIGIVCLYVELHMPGIGVAGVVSCLCFALFFWSRFLGGTAGWLEVILFLVGAGCLALELFVIPGFGVMGVSGILLIIASFVLASQTFIIPHTRGDLMAMGRSLRDLVVAVGIFLGLAAFLSRYFEHLPIFSSMVLKPDEEEEPDVTAAAPGAHERPASDSLLSLVGQQGMTKTPLRPAGKVRLADNRVLDVVAEGDFVESGLPVRIQRVEGNRVVVRAIENPAV